MVAISQFYLLLQELYVLMLFAARRPGLVAQLAVLDWALEYAGAATF
jgi:hypothetical protein